tara:strand:- start:5436 stop:6065 length:630 start_codon:yes stop_codon:yes gene_type:complete
MNKIQAIFSVILLVSFSPLKNGFELSNNPKEILAKLKSTADKTNTIVADFTEETFLAAFSKPQISFGKFHYKASKKMRWTQKSPFEYIIMINDESLRIKNNGIEQTNVGSKKMVRKVNVFMLKMINGDYQDDKDMKTIVYESTVNYMLEMTPTTKPMNKIYSKFEMYFSKSNNRLESIIFFQPGGDKKITTFSHQKYNTILDNSIFTKL